MRLIGFKLVHDSRFLKKYELQYENKNGRLKSYEMVSRHPIQDEKDLGTHLDGISIAAIKDGRLLLLQEFRMTVNRRIYNLCAGMVEDGETVEECIKRELYEETGLSVKRILKILPKTFSAVGISDVVTRIAFVEAEGDLADHTSENEDIRPVFCSKEKAYQIAMNEEMSDRAQMAAYFYSLGLFDSFME